MSNARTTMTPPVYVSLPLAPPKPTEDCGVCMALAKQRAEAETKGDFSRVADCNIELRNHSHLRATDRKSV
ncbi:hypothetical protein DDE74_25890 [Streptomyces lydicus]|uniref:Uncharacterized protein n=1 Tax=Streptomyces lydicus TaxID=47763 RepID=A0A3S9YFY2_9ACTN|nr:hypothetical protein DDE74_25890 [Streptomyces lydicus]